MKRSLTRNRKGAALGLAAALAFALVLLALAFFMISLYFGGSRETRNATDAGALNVGKKCLSITTKSQGGNEDQFEDVADNNNEFGLSNIDRVWGKALFVAMNAQDIKDAGYETSDTSSHASAIYQAAEDISDRLSDKLNDETNLYPLFDEVAKANSVRMLGKDVITKHLAGPNWTTSLLERKQESNVILDKDQVPKEISWSNLKTVQDKAGHSCMPGYQGINMYGHDYWFVPFKYDERPRLESRDHFAANTLASQALSGWAKPVPNTFSVESHTVGGSPADQKAMAVVKANPMKTFKMRIPHAFIRLKFPKNKANWSLNFIPMYESEYGYSPETQFREFYVPACGNGQASVSLGNEYIPPTVFSGLFPVATLLPQVSPWDKLRKALLQRCREIDPSFDDGKLVAILNMAVLTSDDTFFIVPGPTGDLVCVSDSMVTGVAPWISGKKDMAADSENEDFDELWPPYTYSNYVQSWTVECASLTTTAGVGVYSVVDADGTLEWRRGTGYNGFLGEVTVKRETNIRLFGGCSCVF
jgi:hypothetical protein